MIRTFIRVWLAAAVILSPLFSCSIFTQKQTSDTHDLHFRQQRADHTDSIAHVTLHNRTRWHQEHQHEWTEIIPIGPFTYTPDSGFTGQARVIRVLRQQGTQRFSADSSLNRTDNIHRNASSQIAIHSSEQKQTERLFESAPVSPYWYVAGIILLVLLTAFARRGLR